MSSFDITLHSLSEESLSFLRSKYKIFNIYELGQKMNQELYGKEGTNFVFCSVPLDGNKMVVEKVIDTSAVTEEKPKVTEVMAKKETPSETIEPAEKKLVHFKINNNLLAPIQHFTLTSYGNAMFVVPNNLEASYIGKDWSTIDKSFVVNQENGGWWKEQGTLNKSTFCGWLFRSKMNSYLEGLFNPKATENYQVNAYGNGILVIPPYNCFTSYENWDKFIDHSFKVSEEMGGWWKPYGFLKEEVWGWFFKYEAKSYLEQFLKMTIKIKFPTKGKEAKIKTSHVEKVEEPVEVLIEPSKLPSPVAKSPAKLTKKNVEAHISKTEKEQLPPFLQMIANNGSISNYGIGFIVSFPQAIFSAECQKNIISIADTGNGKEYNGIKNVEKKGYFFENEAKPFIESLITSGEEILG